jgi:hypothetical protein
MGPSSLTETSLHGVFLYLLQEIFEQHHILAFHRSKLSYSTYVPRLVHCSGSQAKMHQQCFGELMFLSSDQRRGRGRNQFGGQFRNSFALLLNTGIKIESSVTQSVSFYSSVSPSDL